MKYVFIQVSDSFPEQEEALKKQFKEIDSTIKEFNKLVAEDEEDAKVIQSSVLIPLILNKRNELDVLLTVRNRNISLFDGEVCLPGGRQENRDKNEVHTALREAKEELGIARNNIEVVTILPPVITYRNKKTHLVQPVVGLVRKSFYAKLNPTEVSDVFMVPWYDFINKLKYNEQYKYYFVTGNGVLDDKVYGIRGFTFLLLHVFGSLFYRKVVDQSIMPAINNKYFKWFYGTDYFKAKL